MFSPAQADTGCLKFFTHFRTWPPAPMGGGGHIQFSQKHNFRSIMCIFWEDATEIQTFLANFSQFFSLEHPNLVKKPVKNCNYLNFGLPCVAPRAGLVPLPGKVRAVQTIHHKNWSKMVQNGPKWKFWILAEKVEPPPPGHTFLNRPVDWSGVFLLDSRRTGGQGWKTTLSALFWLKAKSFSKSVRKRPVNRFSKFHLRKFTNKWPLNGEGRCEWHLQCDLSKQNLAKLIWDHLNGWHK